MNGLFRRTVVAAAIFAAAFVSCRTARPVGSPIAPLTAMSSSEAMQQLRERRQAFRGVRSLMRIRATTQGRTQSFRAQLAIHDARRMELIAYTPVGTTALTLTADGESVSMRNHLEDEEWEGSAADLARSLGFLGTSLLPAEVAMLIVGLPPTDDVQYETTPSGVRRASYEDLTAIFEPPAYPAQRVTVTRGEDRVEIEHLEIVE